jgi:hypothetical protein
MVSLSYFIIYNVLFMTVMFPSYTFGLERMEEPLNPVLSGLGIDVYR